VVGGPAHTTVLPPTAVNLLTVMKYEWPTNSPDINPLEYHAYKTFNPKRKKTEECLAVNMGPAAAGFNQQGHTALHIKTSIMRQRCDGHSERALRKTV